MLCPNKFPFRQEDSKSRLYPLSKDLMRSHSQAYSAKIKDEDTTTCPFRITSQPHKVNSGCSAANGKIFAENKSNTPDPSLLFLLRIFCIKIIRILFFYIKYDIHLCAMMTICFHSNIKKTTYMTRLKWWLLLWLFSTNTAISQEKLIRGSVYDEGKLHVPDVLVTVKHHEIIHRLITDDKGEFKLRIPAAKNDSLYVSADKMGYAGIADSLVKINPPADIRITLRETDFALPDIAVSASGNRIEKSDKIIYKLSPGDYLKGAQADIALRNIPDLAISGNDIRMENRKSVTIFIDGIESSFNELTTIKADEIEKVEVISNPSSSFGSELSGGVIHIIRRNRTEHAFKGELNAGKGLRLGKWMTGALLAFQNKWITLNASYTYQTNNQNSHAELDREYPDGTDRQTVDRKTKGRQDFLSARMRIILTPVSNLILSGNLSGYGFNSTNDVLVKPLESDDFTKYIFDSKEGWKNIKLDALYRYQFRKDHLLYVKGKYLNYLNTNETAYMQGSKVNSGIAEYTAEGVYEKTNIAAFSCLMNMKAGYKTIFREYELNRSSFIYQNIHSAYLDFNATVSQDLSLSASLFAEYTRNTAEDIKSDYNRILPLLSLMYKLPHQTNIRLNYSKKITRPSADYLNQNPIIINPLHILVGNMHLLPQDRHSYEAGITKGINNGRLLSLHISRNTYTNLISETLVKEGNMIINSYNNRKQRIFL
jgi:hypothetical protein